MILASIGVILLIFVINVIPAFMPPTWIFLSFIGFNFHLSNLELAVLAVFAALASSSGRAVLAIFADRILRLKFIRPATRENLEVLKRHVEDKKKLTFAFFLTYAFSPLPSGQLFLAYGLTDLKLIIAIIPFFIGRLSSYLFWVFTSSGLSDYLNISTVQSGAFFSLYFILGQVITLYLVYLFTKIDWQVLFTEKKIRLIKKV
jgi:membrane protein YqaA with SNARE-associated domain